MTLRHRPRLPPAFACRPLQDLARPDLTTLLLEPLLIRPELSKASPVKRPRLSTSSEVSVASVPAGYLAGPVRQTAPHTL